MRHASDQIGLVIVFIVTLPALLGGCMGNDSTSDSGKRDNSAVASADLPEVVITAPRPRSKPIVLSARDAGSARH
jgi:hypothetical protein